MAHRTCSIPGCEKPARKPMCWMHLARLRRNGSPYALRRVPRAEMFHAGYSVAEDGCWNWHKLTPSGYGRISDLWVHRYAYELLVGPIPKGLQIDHLCRNRACVNPQHLEPVTQAENLRRGNGWSGQNFRKTQCVHGHPYDLLNTYWRADGTRECRTCNRLRSNRVYHRRKVA